MLSPSFYAIPPIPLTGSPSEGSGDLYSGVYLLQHVKEPRPGWETPCPRYRKMAEAVGIRAWLCHLIQVSVQSRVEGRSLFL